MRIDFTTDTCIALGLSLMLFVTASAAAQEVERDDDGTISPPARTAYVLIPITGPIGRDLSQGVDAVDEATVTAEGMEAVLGFAARKRGLEHIVFEFDSAGGSLEEAQRIVKVLQSHADRFTYHAVIRRSLDAALPLALCAEHIYVDPDNSGAIIAFTKDASSSQKSAEGAGAPAWMNELRTIAAKNGHNPTIVDALILPERELFAWTDDAGALKVSGARPTTGANDVHQIDAARTALKLSANDAVDLGFAERAGDGVASIGVIRSLHQWEQYGQYGEAQMARALKELNREEGARRKRIGEALNAVDQAKAVLAELPSAARAAREADPNRYKYETRRTTRRRGGYIVEVEVLTTAARRLWTERTDDSAEKWRAIQNAISQMQRQVALVKKNGSALEEIEPRWDVAAEHAAQLENLRTGLKSILDEEATIARYLGDSESALRKLAKERNP